MMFALVALLLFLGGYTRSVLGSLTAADSSQDAAVAAAAAREAIESLKLVPFSAAFAAFNDDPGDDPGGVGTAPGANFDVPQLQVRADDADGMVGRFVFPTLDGVPGELREDADMPALGMPRDLDLDGNVENTSVSGDYRMLPVIVRLEWRTTKGPAVFTFKTVLADN